MLKAFRERHDFVVDALNKIPGVVCLPADGTFYCFPHVQEAIDRLDNINDDIGLAEYLIDKAGVALVPGSAFGAPGYVRFSFATGLDVLREALSRLTAALTA
jgi:aspartate aminotransferase